MDVVAEGSHRKAGFHRILEKASSSKIGPKNSSIPVSAGILVASTLFFLVAGAFYFRSIASKKDANETSSKNATPTKKTKGLNTNKIQPMEHQVKSFTTQSGPHSTEPILSGKPSTLPSDPKGKILDTTKYIIFSYDDCCKKATKLEVCSANPALLKQKVTCETNLQSIPNENCAVVLAMTDEWVPGNAANVVFTNNPVLKSLYRNWFTEGNLPSENEVVILKDQQNNLCLVLISGSMKSYESDAAAFVQEVSRRANTVGCVLEENAPNYTWYYVPFATGLGTKSTKLREEAEKCHIESLARSCHMATKVKILCKQEESEHWMLLRDQTTFAPIKGKAETLKAETPSAIPGYRIPGETHVVLQNLADLGIDSGKPEMWAGRSIFESGTDGAKKEEDLNLQAYNNAVEGADFNSLPQNFCFIRDMDVADIFHYAKKYQSRSDLCVFVEGSSNQWLSVNGSGQMIGFAKGFEAFFGNPVCQSFNKTSPQIRKKVEGQPLNILGYQESGAKQICQAYLTQGPCFQGKDDKCKEFDDSERELLQSTLHAVSHVIDRKKSSKRQVVHFRSKICGNIYAPKNKELNSIVEKSLVGSCIREAIANPDVLVCLLCEDKHYKELNSKFETILQRRVI
eukprot:GHVP01048339.1.p1 GENE.GHVP01048339.1~~GHVP01048339.1.p1  ORF type:complete len:628 (-),score=114.97 GHVP01048339.1:474-2357(-)